MAHGSDEKIHALALHSGQIFLTEKNRRILDVTGDFCRFAQILLGNEYDGYLNAAADQLSQMPSADLLTFTDSDYPPLLREITYAPFALYLKGERSLLSAPGNFVSIVGTREPSAAGRSAAARIAETHVRSGSTIVSGIARGIDGIAHHAALSAGGQTIAVLPNGTGHLYPLENRDLYAAANTGENLLLVSEYAPGQKPQRHFFIRRNRIIAGFSPLTIFVEGGVKSGGMITVNYALSEGRDVGALSHPTLVNNAGGEKLIADGALDLTVTAFPSETHPISA